MDKIWLNMGISFVLAAINESFKNPGKKRELRAVLLKIRDSINMLYIADPDFEALSAKRAEVEQFKKEIGLV